MPKKIVDIELIHFIDPGNLKKIRQEGELCCALDLMNADERKCHADKTRQKCLPLKSGVVLRDQKPLTKKNNKNLYKVDNWKVWRLDENQKPVKVDDEWFAKFVKYLNQHVFFWPDTKRGKEGIQKFCNKYSDHIKLRCRLGDLMAANNNIEILLSPYNSGSIPLGKPKESPRSLDLFRKLECPLEELEVVNNEVNGIPLVEIVVKGKVKLPCNTQYEDKLS